MKNKILAVSLAILAAASAYSVPAPIAVWSGNGTAVDTANGNNGTLHNGVSYAAGKWGQAFSFDGSDDLITTADSASLDRPHVTNAITICMWVKWNGQTPYGYNPLVRKASFSSAPSSSPWRTYDFGINSNGTIFLSLSDGVANGQTAVLASTTAISANTWFHIAGTYDGITLKTYINGVLSGTLASSLVIGESAGPIFIGRDEWGGWGKFGGLLDEIEVYDQALTTGEIQGRRDFNLPPTANAGADRIEYIGTNTQTDITLSGALSTDPENQSLTYSWSGSFGTATGVSPTITLPLGIHEVELDVADEYNQTSATIIHIAVVQGVNGSTYSTLQTQLNTANNQVTALTAQNSMLLTLLQSLRAKFVQIQEIAQDGIDEIDLH